MDWYITALSAKPLVKDLAVPRCFVAKMPAKPGEGVEVNLQLPAKRICKQFGDFVTYIFPPDTSESAPDDSTPRHPVSMLLLFLRREQKRKLLKYICHARRALAKLESCHSLHRL